MKTILKNVARLALLTLLLAGPAWGAPEGAQKAAALLDYIAADYGGAVADGAIVSQFEYDEQLEFLGAVRKLLADVAPPAGIAGGLDRLEAAMKEKKGADVVAPLALEARRGILGHYEIVQSPERAPDAARGAKIFRETCASCHAADGSGQTPVAATFEVKPPDFRDPEGALARSPFRAFNTVTFGVEGTPMPGFGQLSDAQRWDVAFYVTTLAHGGPKPEAAAPALPAGFDASLPALAAENDGALRERLGRDAASLAYLRATAPYVARVEAAGGVAEVRRHLDRVRQGLAAGDLQAARLAALDAYLEGFEPIEARVGAIDQDLVIETERIFGKMRAAIERGDAPGATAALAETDAVLGRVEARLGGQEGLSSASLFVASAVILLREGLEVVLLVGLMLALLGRMGRDDAKRWVHRGWMAALAAGGLTWVAATWLVQVSGRSREVLEGVVALVAAVVLLFVSHWFLSAAEKQRWLAFLKTKVAGSEGRVLPLFGLAFLAVYREAFETVLFYQALVLDSPGGGLPILGGLGAGLAAVAVFGFLLLRAGRKLPLGPLFMGSGLILCVLCVTFVGQGLAALREAGVLSPQPLDLPTIPWLGFYPDRLGLIAQGAMVALIAGLLLVPRLRGRGAPAT